jgi:hypothetical protein
VRAAGTWRDSGRSIACDAEIHTRRSVGGLAFHNSYGVDDFVSQLGFVGDQEVGESDGVGTTCGSS